MIIATHYNNPTIIPERPANVSLTVNNNQHLDFISYAIATERLGELITYYKYEMEEGADGNFMVILPRPPGPLHQWMILICGYRDGVQVLEVEKNAMEIFF